METHNALCLHLPLIGLTEHLHQGSDSPILHVGSGNESCATWLATPLSENNAKDWIFGFWSGENLGIVANGLIGHVGHTTDALGIIGEVKKVCMNTPSESLATAVSEVFINFLKADK